MTELAKNAWPTSRFGIDHNFIAQKNTDFDLHPVKLAVKSGKSMVQYKQLRIKRNLSTRVGEEGEKNREGMLCPSCPTCGFPGRAIAGNKMLCGPVYWDTSTKTALQVFPSHDLGCNQAHI